MNHLKLGDRGRKGKPGMFACKTRPHHIRGSTLEGARQWQPSLVWLIIGVVGVWVWCLSEQPFQSLHCFRKIWRETQIRSPSLHQKMRAGRDKPFGSGITIGISFVNPYVIYLLGLMAMNFSRQRQIFCCVLVRTARTTVLPISTVRILRDRCGGRGASPSCQCIDNQTARILSRIFWLWTK
jgi:hypothetical protein